MIRAKEFSHFMDRKKPDFFHYLKQMKLISKQANNYQELTEKEKKAYQENKREYIDQYEPEKWKKVMA